MVGFSLDDYCEMLSAFKNTGYSFCQFEEVNACLAGGRSFVVLRHDIDISLRPALEIAQAEYEQGVQATYFVLLRSPFYNLCSHENVELIQRIQQYGHQIAAHIDLTFYDNDCLKALKEVEIVAQCFPSLNTELVSLHSPYPLNRIPIALSQQLENVYGAAVRGEMAYISDSTGRWRYGHPLASEAFKVHQPIQLLTHPIWWIQEGETAAQKLERWLYTDFQNDRTTLKAFLPKLFRLGELP